ncbi:methyltransferase domain-containing protein [Flammeovirga sp. EKP202]|uniref:methyltransferase domain-containing protein n=1 Tax=Flammeovirga sp. EKP202 TaxID=2770592 RepID=UPI00165F6D7F|nr:methyltransferase domain-containing protein [Flammeovirga sp. EKP202]MBD0402793.1 methyltransferase domain-containing protein [Flammeovirga sp. EKP202]
MDKQYWTEKYESNNTGWDIGYISTPLKEYIDQLEDKELKILIPGVGNGYEIEYLWQLGFKNCYAVDISEAPLQNVKKRCPDFPEEQLLCSDFFQIDIGHFNLILEQTFFCALNPSLRKQYVEQMYRLLKKGGKLSGLLFDFELTKNGPPFGGSKEEYLSLFEPKFDIKILERCYNSIPPRSGNELFFSFEK